VEYLSGTHPAALSVLIVLGIVELTEIPRDDPTFTSQHIRHTIRFERLSGLMSDPTGLFEEVYGWGNPAANLTLLLERLYELALVIGLPASLVYPVFEKEVNLSAPATIPDEGEAENLELRIPIVGTGDDETAAEAGVTLMPVPPPVPGGAPGLALCPYATGTLSESIPLDSRALWILTIQGGLDLVVGIGLIFRPGETLKVLTDILGTSTSASGQLSADLRRQALPDERIVLIGTSNGTGLTAMTLSGLVALVVGTGQETEFKVELLVDGGRMRLAFDSVDSFLASLLPSEPVDLLFDLGVGWSNRKGLYFTGGAGFEYSLPVHESIGPLRLDILHFGLKFKDGTVRNQLAITGGAALGPLAVTVESIGLELLLSFPESGGNLGPANLEPTFKPPNGIGLAIDAGVVKGGGYLYLDYEKGEYAGALELTVSDWLALKAIGLINTKLPGGQPGFSMLIIITAEFSPGIQLGFGFTLIGVGGLVGLNRTMLLDPLVQGVRTGAVNSILFPTDIVANAPKIISDLRAIFPPQEGIFLIGPMAKIGWGTPTLISVSLGVIIEIPGNVVILGRLLLALPTEEEAVLVLQVSFVGALEFDKHRIWFFATLYDSRVLFITLEGEMGLLMDFSDDPNFVLSVGGFHPRFTAPPLPFPSPARLSLSIINESWARLQAETYFAVTSNSVQIGARADAFFGFDALSVEGYFSFDALLRFSPFYFIVEVSTGFSVKVFGVGVWGVHLRGSLEGPTPWHINGSAKIELLFFSISVDVDVTFGESRAETLPPITVMPLLKAEYEKIESWRATLPASGKLYVSLRELGEEAALVLHPVGTLQISQRFAPLNLTLDKIGNQKPSDVNQASVSVTAGSLEVKGPVKERFASGQYFEMDDAAKLSAPAFELMESGVELSAAGQPWSVGSLAVRNVRYELIILDSAFKRFQTGFFKFWDALFTHFRAGAAISRSSISLANEKRMKPFEDRVIVTGDQYTVAFQSDNSAIAATATYSSYAEAQAHLAEAVQLDPSLAEEVHVIPFAEVNR
jgi:hypothetical protein